jgi:hypothetical protein
LHPPAHARGGGLASFVVPDDRDRHQTPGRTSVERMIAPLDEREAAHRTLSSRARQARRSVEGYLRAGVRPRWMERVAEIDGGIARERRRLERAYRDLGDELGHDREAFAHRWRAMAESWRFDHLNDLIEQHNEWYPVERDLPMDPRTRDYVPVHGRSYRRPHLDRDWVLEQFPAS